MFDLTTIPLQLLNVLWYLHDEKKNLKNERLLNSRTQFPKLASVESSTKIERKFWIFSKAGVRR